MIGPVLRDLRSSPVEGDAVAPLPHPAPSLRPRARQQKEPPAAPQPPAANLQAIHFTEAQLGELWRGRRFPAGALVTRRGVPRPSTT
jgi:hypothetical protein